MIKLSTLVKEHLLLKEGVVKNREAIKLLASLMVEDITLKLSRLSFNKKEKLATLLLRYYAVIKSKGKLHLGDKDRAQEFFGLKNNLRSSYLHHYLPFLQTEDVPMTDDFMALFDAEDYKYAILSLKFETNNSLASYNFRRKYLYINLISPMFMNKVLSGIVGKYISRVSKSIEKFNAIDSSPYIEKIISNLEEALRQPSVIESASHELTHMYNNFRIKDWESRSFKDQDLYNKYNTLAANTNVRYGERVKANRKAFGIYLDFNDEIWARVQQALVNLSSLSDESIKTLVTTLSSMSKGSPALTYFNGKFLKDIYQPEFSGWKYGGRAKKIPIDLKKRLLKVYTQALYDIVEKRNMFKSKYKIKRDEKLADLSSSNLNYSRRRLIGREFNNVNLAGATFEYANLTNAKFINSNLEDIDLTGAEIVGTEFINCIFSPEVFFDVRDSNFNSVKFENITLISPSSMDGDFINASFFNCKITDASFFEAIFTDTSFDTVEFYNTNFGPDAELSNTYIKNTKFVNCDLSFFNFSNVRNKKLDLVKFVNCKLGNEYGEGTDFSGVDLSNVKGLETCTGLDTIQYDENTIWPKGFNILNYTNSKQKTFA